MVVGQYLEPTAEEEQKRKQKDLEELTEIKLQINTMRFNYRMSKYRLLERELDAYMSMRDKGLVSDNEDINKHISDLKEQIKTFDFTYEKVDY